MYSHTCIKCDTHYDSSEPDPYYCDTCDKERKALAAEVDKKLANRPKRETRSALQEYDASPKVNGYVHVRL